jgi:hypothetical protein
MDRRKGMFEVDGIKRPEDKLLGSSGDRLHIVERTSHKHKPPKAPKLSKKFKSPHRRGVI